MPKYVEYSLTAIVVVNHCILPDPIIVWDLASLWLVAYRFVGRTMPQTSVMVHEKNRDENDVGQYICVIRKSVCHTCNTTW